MKVIEITPADSTEFDSIIIEAGNAWEDTLHRVESVLDSQWHEMTDGSREWSDIAVTVQCREMSQEQLDELTGGDDG